MLTISDLKKQFGTRTLFDGASLVVNRGERIGLIGRNGYGKSTLLRIINGKEAADAGTIALDKEARAGVLEQYFDFKAESALKEAEQVLPLLEGSYRETYLAEQILEGLGFDKALRGKPPKQLSGGFQIRLNLAKLLLSDPDLLLLDEPTNYLDIISVRGLEQFLLDWKGAAIIISHDRTFIDKVSTHIALIHRKQIRKSSGTTAKLYERIEEEEEIHEKTRLNQLKERERQEQFIRTYRSKARQASRVQSRVKALEKMDVMEKLASEDELRFQFSYKKFTPKWILHVDELAFGYGEQPLFSELKFSVGAKDRIAIVGANGKGKSTLLAVLHGDLKAQTGSIQLHSSASVGFLGQSNVELLVGEATVEQSILEVEAQGNRTRARTIAGCMLFSGDDAEKEIRVLSGGEKTRVNLGRIIARETNLLFLDEPTNHLDYHASQALLEALDSYPGAVILVTHDEEFLRRIARKLIVFKDETATLFEGAYDDFLRREGWGKSQAEEKEQPKSKPNYNKKELRRLKAEINRERTEAVGELRKEVSRLEDEIDMHEKAIATEEHELIEITKQGFNDRAAELSRSVAKRRYAIEQLFESLERKSAELEARDKYFVERLEEL